MTSIVVDDIEARQVSEDEKRRCFFFKWKAREGYNATYRRLIEGLMEISNQEDIDSVCKLLKESDSVHVRTQQPIASITPLLSPEHNRTPGSNADTGIVRGVIPGGAGGALAPPTFCQ